MLHFNLSTVAVTKGAVRTTAVPAATGAAPAPAPCTTTTCETSCPPSVTTIADPMTCAAPACTVAFGSNSKPVVTTASSTVVALCAIAAAFAKDCSGASEEEEGKDEEEEEEVREATSSSVDVDPDETVDLDRRPPLPRPLLRRPEALDDAAEVEETKSDVDVTVSRVDTEALSSTPSETCLR